MEKIRSEVKQGKTKAQVAREMNLPINTISNHTLDIYKIKKKPDISYRSFLLLQELMNKGYAFPCPRYGPNEYQILKKKFPRLFRITMHGKTIFYLEDKSDIAVKAFLESLKNKKITTYHQLKQITKTFKININSEEKKRYIQKKKSKRRGFGKNFEAVRLLEKDDSFVKIEHFHLLVFVASFINKLMVNDQCWA